jgi:hypothetical protein
LEVDAGCTTVLITILDSLNRHRLIPFAPHRVTNALITRMMNSETPTTTATAVM